MAPADNIVHDQARNRFTLPGEGGEALLEYRILAQAGGEQAPSRIDFVHTYVPPALRGQGMAERLVRHGLKWARDQGYEIRASCWYVSKFLR